MAKSTRSAVSGKADKPRHDFRLFPHVDRRWAKKVKGKLRDYGKWFEDPAGKRRLQLWVEEKDELLAGKPRA